MPHRNALLGTALYIMMMAFASSAMAFDRDTGRPQPLDTRTAQPRPAAAVSAFSRAWTSEEIVWDPASGAPVAIAGDRAGTDELDRLRSSMARGVELSADAERPERVELQAAFEGRPIYPGRLTLTRGRTRFLIAGSFVLDARVLAARRQIDLGAARDRALAHLGVTRTARPPAVRPVWFDTRQGLADAYLVSVATRSPPGDFRVVVDAASGRVLHVADLACALDGVAGVYRVNPLRSGVTVEPIDHLRRQGRLEGEHVEVENEDTPMQASDSNNRFVYPPQNKHLDEANAYYHVDRAHDFFKARFGFDGLDTPMAVGVYYGENLDNAYYVPWGNYIVLGDGGRYNVMSRDASVMLHEYTHAVTHKLAGFGVGGEAAALSEGTSDYFAASIGDDPRVGEWIVAKIGKPYLRSCESPKRYPDDLAGESHQDGTIWAATLWDLRTALGALVADELAFHAVAALGSEATMPAAGKALLQADADRFAGAHREVVEAVLTRRGLGGNDRAMRRAVRIREAFRALGER
ncbi:MAG: M36 family metallopeptidase [Candidatus Wallbacteria bacterium]|nr:M36 family metallopeptidase [Candidatus Wallbacteria bacterium]